MRDILRPRGLHAASALLALLLLAPTPVPQPLAGPVREARRYAESRHPLAALRALEDALAFDTSLASLHLAAARAALSAGLPESALAHLDRLQDAAPAEAQVRCLRCTAYQEMGSWQVAADCWRAAPTACSSDVVFLEHMQAAYRHVGDLEAALHALQRLSEQAPDDATVARRLGLLWATSDPEAALPYLRLAADQGDVLCQSMAELIYAASDDEPALLLTRLGQALTQAKEWDLAAAAFRQALTLQPDLHEARAYLGLALDNTGGDGEGELLAAVAAAPRSPLTHLLLALHFRTAGRPQQALRELEESAALDPASPAILAEMAAAYEALGDLAAARDAYRAAAELARSDPDFWLLLAEFALSHEAEIEEVAVPAARNAAALEPGNPDPLSALGYAHYLAGRPSLADRCLRRALDQDPLDARLQLRWGLLKQSQGDLPAALAALNLAAELDLSGPVGMVARRTAEALASQ